MQCNVMSMWSLRCHFTNRSVTVTPYNIKVTVCHTVGTLWWRVRWLEQWRLQVAAELQQRWRRKNRRRKSIPRSSSSHREGSITQRGASCGRYNQRRRWSRNSSWRSPNFFTCRPRCPIYVASFRNHGASKIIGSKNWAKFRTFWPCVKRVGWAKYLRKIPCKNYDPNIDTFHRGLWIVSGIGNWLAKKNKGKTYMSSDVERP